MAQPPSMGVAAHCGFNSNTNTTSASAATSEIEFLDCQLATQRELVRTEGIRGTRIHPVERVRTGRKTPNGMVRLQPTYAELAGLLPFCVAAAAAQSGYNTYTPSDTVPIYHQWVVDKVAKVHSFVGCKVGRAIFSAMAGQALELSMEIHACDESIGNAGSFPSLTISQTPPFVFTDLALTIGGTTYQCMSWRLIIDWHLKLDRFVNSLVRTDIPSMDLTIMEEMILPWTSDTTGLLDVDPASSLASVANFTYGGAGGGASGVNLSFTSAGLIFPANHSPVVASKDELTLSLVGEARKNGSTAPLVVALDSTS